MLSICIRYIKKIDQSQKIHTSRLETKANKKNSTIVNAKNIIFILQVSYLYIKTFIFLTTLNNKL